MKKLFLLSLSLFVFILSFAQFSPHYYALKDVSVIDGISKNVLEHYTIIIRDKKIEAVGPAKETPIPDSAVVFYYPGKFVAPGLIDSHVHLATDPSGDDKRARAETDLKAMLISGITSVRDMAGDARVLASLSRDANLDEIVSPDIYYSALIAGPSFFSDPRTQTSTAGAMAGSMPFMRAVTDSTDLRLAIAEAKGTGATGIKLYAELSGPLAKKITEEAHRQHMLVWSHGNLDEATPLQVIDACVNVISHAAMLANWHAKTIPAACLRPGLSQTFWDSVFKTLPATTLINAMKQHGTILDATVTTFGNAVNDTSLPQNRKLIWLAMYELGKRFTSFAKGQGIPVCAGTDFDERKFVQREMKSLVHECGFTPMEALVSATKNSAMAIGIDKTTGTIAKGKIADLVLFDANPAADIENIDKVVLVIKNGKLFNHQ